MDKVCPHCGATVYVAGDTTKCYMCPRCGPVDPVERMGKVFQGGGPLLGQAVPSTEREETCHPG